MTCKDTEKDFEDAKENLMPKKSTWYQSKLEMVGMICIGIELSSAASDDSQLRQNYMNEPSPKQRITGFFFLHPDVFLPAPPQYSKSRNWP